MNNQSKGEHIKKILTLASFLILTGIVFSSAASNGQTKAREFESYVDTGFEQSAEVTLSASAGQISTVTVPSNAKGFRMYPRTNAIRFSVELGTSESRVVAAVGTVSTGAAIAESDLTNGGVVKPDAWETRLLPATTPSVQRFIYLRSITASVVVDFEIF